ncbi:unnamed protein product [Chrysoparadoxa australica]
MQRNFLDMKKFLESHFPELQGSIKGELYPPPPYAIAIAQAAGIAQMVGMAMVLGGGFLFTTLGIPEPAFYQFLKEHKWSAGIGLFVANSMANNLLATGAFELHLDGNLVYSKLETNKFPSAQELFAIMKANGLKKY